jgi:SAM-dependent methyltransferase
MNPETYALAAQVEDEHWWFSARRSILRAVLDRHLPPASGRTLLELGCGNGGNLPLLARYGKLYAVEMDDEARRRATMRGIAAVQPGALPDAIPFAGQQFDVVAALDVLEHVAEEHAALVAMRAKLRRGGCLLLTVPAFKWLWSRHDEASNHRRRYSKSALIRQVREAGFEIAHATYFNTVLFPAVAAYIKLWTPFTADAHPGLRLPPRPVNALLRATFSAERYLVPRLTLPFGLSILLVGIAA